MSDTQKITPNLFKISNLLEKNRIELASYWVEIVTLKALFKIRNISSLKFRNSYAIPILDYFIAVVRDEKSIGDCPAMSKLVHFLLSKEITPREVFDICTGLKRTLLIFLLAQKVVVNKPIPFVEELSSIFDANLSGVLEIFTNLYAVAQKKLATAKLQAVKLHQTLKIINNIDTKIIMINKGNIVLANEPFLNMLGVKHLNELDIGFKNELKFLNNISMYKNYFNSNQELWIKKVCKQSKPFVCEIFNEESKRSFYYSVRVTYMPDSTYGEYIMTFSNISEHIKDEKEFHYLLTHDELTGLRNYPAFEKLIWTKIDEVKKSKSRLFLVIIDIPELREMNKKEGLEYGDLIISKLIESLKFLVDKDVYLARLEGSRFGVLLEYKDELEAYDWSLKLYERVKKNHLRIILAMSEVDLSETINKLFLRVYELIEKSNRSEDKILLHDFKNIVAYKNLPNQDKYIENILHYKSVAMSLFYMELPIVFEAEIVSCMEDSVVLTLSSKQIGIAAVDMPIYFKLNSIGNIKAYIKEIDKKKNRVIIHKFRSDRHSPLSRRLFRVKVLDTIKAYIEESNREYSVEILDMNYEFIAIEIDRKRNFDFNSVVFIDMLLPMQDSFESLQLQAKIIRVEKNPQGYKMVLSFETDDESEKILQQYISNCQMKIMHDFKL
jgi:diguanylate cyclase (GGDEF)-like protein